VLCKPLRNRPNQAWLATCAAGLVGVLVDAGVFRLNRLNMRWEVPRM